MTSPRHSVLARVEFSFRGETHALETYIDLDRCLIDSGAEGEAPDFHLKLAQAGGIDPYSYLYEVLASHDIVFSDATGAAAACCHAGAFDWRGFVTATGDAAEHAAVERVARAHGIDLAATPAVAAALRDAYRAGRQD